MLRADKKEPLMHVWDLGKNFYMMNMMWSRGYDKSKHLGIVAKLVALSGGVAYSWDAGEILGLCFCRGHYQLC